MGNTILVAEDDFDIISVLKMFLENEGFIVKTANDGIEALETLKNEDIDLAIVDIMMPKMNGYELVKELRKFSSIPVIIASANNQDSDKILGLDIGADDYLTKPFNPLEVVARVKSQLRRCYKLNENVNTGAETLEISGLVLDIRTFSLIKNGEPISLTPFEFKILKKFMESPNQIFTKAQIYESISGDYFESDENTIMVHISKIRDKIGNKENGEQYIKTVRGLGYKLEK